MKKTAKSEIKDLKEQTVEEVEFSVFDFETTGISAKTEKVIEIGIAKVKKGKVVDTFQSFINPGRPVPYNITLITGITNEDVKDAPYFDELFESIKSFIGDSVLVAHNLSFDYSFLKNECERANIALPENPSICTLKIAKKLYPHLPSRSLGKLSQSLKIRHRNVHRGLGDAIAAAKILVKMLQPLKEEHSIETVNDLIHFQHLPSGVGFKLIKKKLVNDFVKIPEEPGIYFFRDSKGKIIYIGKAKSLKQRVGNYFLSSTPRKTRKIITKAQGLSYQVTNTELTALLAEAELIKEENPSLNTLLKKYSNNYFVVLARTKPFPAIETVNTFDFDGNDYFGPYPNRDTTRIIKEIVDKTFELRECSEKELAKKRRCYLADIQRCLAPCVESTINEKYLVELNKVSDFLCGNNQTALDHLLKKMKELSELKKYEEAAHVRDVVNLVLKQLNKASILSEPINNANVLIEIAGEKDNDYLLLLEGKIIIRNFFIDSSNSFMEALESYFNGTVHLFKKLTEKDLERLKIALSWMVRNKNRIKVHYLKQFNSVDDLSHKLIFMNKDRRDYLEKNDFFTGQQTSVEYTE